MDSHDLIRSPTRQIPTFTDLEAPLGAHDSDNWISPEISNDWGSLNDFYFCSPEPISSQWPSWVAPGSELRERPNEDQALLQTSDDPIYSLTHATGESNDPNLFHLQPQSTTHHTQWLDGAFHPPVPCGHCRRHRLQCLIIRTTSANPNPVSSCSSCVALFRECSLAKGEKRLPSGFETFSPVLGHLHGLPEHVDNPGDQIVPSVESMEERKESKQFVRKGARVLREWFYQNQEVPYPSEDQKMKFSTETGFSQKRISTWFANARRRQKQHMQMSNATLNRRTRAGSPLITSTLSSLTPLERWKASPPEDEPVDESVIQDAIALDVTDPITEPFEFDTSTMELFNFDASSSHLPSSNSSFGSRASESSESVSSAWSHHSGERSLPFPLLSQSSRSRSRLRDPGSESSDERMFQCTFCTRSFRKRHDWARHEKSVHISLDSWICTPDLECLKQGYSTLVSECKFCDTVLPTEPHWEEHEFHVCAERPIADRSFSRKDYLWQHLRKFHSCTKIPVQGLESWRGLGARVESRCGFCDQTLSTWNARTDHLAAHFKDGMRMDQWVGNWGLGPSAMAGLRNAVLPNQRRTNI